MQVIRNNIRTVKDTLKCILFLIMQGIGFCNIRKNTNSSNKTEFIGLVIPHQL